MILVYILVGLLTVLYSCLIAYYAYHWNRIPVSEPTLPLNPQPVSIVIAARNEEKHVVSCVQSCLNQNYPPHLLEVIVVDDQSEDDTNDLLEAIEDPRFKLMRLGVYRRTTIKGSKKKALAYGIHHASGTIICTTDADCLVPPDWVRHMVSRFAEPQVRLVSGPVGIHHPEKAIHYFQALDFSANGLINGSGLQSGLHHLCNGANLAYRKSDFLEQDAFEDNYHIAS
ncbi:MAG TPA: glycosyltransferase, partial [Saprospiraceae bacterium]|nr:glycosyltransferase [Saprospiraceae bacterium]